MPLKSEAIDWIFAKMTVRYGAAWIAKWNGIPMEAVGKDWAAELGNTSRDSIVYALGYLPLDFPPTVLQFREICRRAPNRDAQQAQLNAPVADPKRVSELLAKAQAMQAARQPRQWAYDLRDRETAGERLTEPQRMAWRRAIRSEPTSASIGNYTPIDSRCLPPGMKPKEQDAAYERAEERYGVEA